MLRGANSVAVECEPGTTVVFGNGVQNTYIDATLAMYKTRRTYRESANPSVLPNTQYDVAYNPSVKFLADAAETFYQMLTPEQRQLPLPQILRALDSKGPLLGIPDVDVAALIAQQIAKIDANEVKRVSDVHVNQYLDSIEAGRRVILIAHSQGNLFALQAYHDLAVRRPDLAPYIQVLAVATPASSVIDKYVTSTKDLVIKALPEAPHGNVTNNFDANWADYILGHAYSEVYLDPGQPSRSVIGAHLYTMSTFGPFPAKCLRERTEIVKVKLPFERYQDGARGAFRPQQSFSMDVPRFDPALGQLKEATLNYELEIYGSATCPNPSDYPPSNACVGYLLLGDFVVGSVDLQSDLWRLLCDDHKDGTSLCAYPFNTQLGAVAYQWDQGSREILKTFSDVRRPLLLGESWFVMLKDSSPTWRLDGYFTLNMLTSLGRIGTSTLFYATAPSLTSFVGNATITFTIIYRYTPAPST